MAIAVVVLVIFVSVAGLLLFIYWKDELKPEPLSALACTLVVGAIGGAIGNIFDVWNGVEDIYAIPTPMRIGATVWAAFMEAWPDHLLQVIILIVAMSRNKFFDEQLDGIVYAVFIALGYVFGRNIIYLWPDTTDIFTIGVLRSMMLVPIYYFCAVLMGYYYSRLRFRHPRRVAYDLASLLLIPLLCRVILDSALLLIDFPFVLWQGILFTFFLFFLVFFFMHYTLQRIESHLTRDWTHHNR